MSDFRSNIILLKERTHRKVATLSKELDMKRARLEKFIAGELSKFELTVKEWGVLSRHPVFQDLLGDPSEDNRKVFTVQTSVCFKQNERERAFELLERYLLSPFLSVARGSVREPVTHSESRPIDLIFSFQVNELRVETQDESFAGVKTRTIMLDAADQKVFDDYMNQLCLDDGEIMTDILNEYYATISYAKQLVSRNIYSERNTKQLQLDFLEEEAKQLAETV